jgi:hypothetical protein
MGAVLGEGQPVGFPCRRLTTPQLYIILRSNPLEADRYDPIPVMVVEEVRELRMVKDV